MALAASLAACSAPGGRFEVTGASWRDGPPPALELTLSARFTPELLAALDQGIPLVLEVRVELDDARTALRSTRRYELSYSPLSARYRLRELDSGAERSFGYRALLLAALDRLVVPLPPEAATLGADARARVHVSLPGAGLPAPLRLPALWAPQWRMAAADHAFRARG